MKYRVKIYEAPYVYDVEAKNKAEAELKVVDSAWGKDYDTIKKIVVTKIK